MKKKIRIASMLILALVYAGCQQKEEEEAPVEPKLTYEEVLKAYEGHYTITPLDPTKPALNVNSPEELQKLLYELHHPTFINKSTVRVFELNSKEYFAYYDSLGVPPPPSINHPPLHVKAGESATVQKDGSVTKRLKDGTIIRMSNDSLMQKSNSASDSDDEVVEGQVKPKIMVITVQVDALSRIEIRITYDCTNTSINVLDVSSRMLGQSMSTFTQDNYFVDVQTNGYEIGYTINATWNTPINFGLGTFNNYAPVNITGSGFTNTNSGYGYLSDGTATPGN